MFYDTFLQTLFSDVKVSLRYISLFDVKVSTSEHENLHFKVHFYEIELFIKNADSNGLIFLKQNVVKGN